MRKNNPQPRLNIINKTSFLTYPLISFILGIFWQQKFEFCHFVLSISIVILTISLFLFSKETYFIQKSKILICFIFFFSGSFLFQEQKNNHFCLLNKIINHKIDVIAQIENKEKIESKIKEILNLKIEQIKKENNNDYKNTNFNILCYSRATTNTQVGDKVTIKNIKLSNPQKVVNLANNTNYLDYLIKENILSTFFISKPIIQVLYTPSFSVKRFAYNIKNKIYKNIKNKINIKTFSFFSSIFLGNKNVIQFSFLKNIFNYWGISHYLARSGLHILLFILIWNFFLGLLPINIKLKKLILITLSCTYLIFSWTSISFIRAFYVFILYEIGKILNQQTNFLHLLTLICLYILLFNPIQLFFLDFQLSFALTFSLAWLNKTLATEKNMK